MKKFSITFTVIKHGVPGTSTHRETIEAHDRREALSIARKICEKPAFSSGEDIVSCKFKDINPVDEGQ